MKRYLTTIILVIACLCANAQGNMQDVVYLKNGVILRGMIMEQIPGKTIKIQTADGSLFVYNLSDVEKIAKEETPRNKPSGVSTPGQGARRGYLAFTLGVALPAGEDMDGLKPGFQLNLLQFGYLFSKYVGMTASWNGSANKFNSIDEFMSAGGLMIGPMFSIPKEKFNVDIRPQIGYAVTTLPDPTGAAAAASFSLGANFRYHPTEKMSLIFGLDYFTTTPEWDVSGFKFDVKYSMVNMSVGIAYRLR